ncbi:MAG TPA: DNA-binding protein [Polyangiaceae bacterium]|nr:DNA-binding protein [Polyangiaceae bacterium]HYQ25981.1 DNA-binding protein [Polyangiaceae bacterium]
MSNIDDELRKAVESFVEQLKGLIQRAALESVQTALNGGNSASRSSAKRPLARAAVGAQHYEAGSKRSPAELAVLIKKLHSHIARHPGQRIEKIGAGLGVPTKALVLPVKRLIGEKKVTTKGQKRATTYFAH